VGFSAAKQTETNMNPHASNPKRADSLPQAIVKRSHLSWALWLVPLGAAGLCAWFAWRDYVSAGPTISITFENTDGLEAKNTQLKYRGVNVGVVNSLSLSKDGSQVKVEARMTSSARNLIRAGSIFWIVRPELKIGSISGLRTIVSGEYITLRPGRGPLTNSFKGAGSEPAEERPGALQLSFLAPDLGSLQAGSPILYRGVTVGEVLDFQLAGDSRDVAIHARVWEEYAPLVRPESKFWNAGGVDVHVGLFKGLEVNAQPGTIFSGGIEFATPPSSGMPATNGSTFVLNEKPEDKWKAWAPEMAIHVSGPATSTNESPGLGGKNPASLIGK
jgi:paraquat-inducible protein B